MLPDWFLLLGVTDWPLAACAVLTVAISFERIVFFVRNHVAFNQHAEALSNYLLAHQSLAKPLRDEMVGVMLNELQPAYYRGLKVMRIIATISPLLGLLGTILGIIVAFKTIALQTGPVSPSLIADGLWEAMLTTAVGLIIALPALLLAHIFRYMGETRLNLLSLRLNKPSLNIEMDACAEKVENNAVKLNRKMA